MSGGIFDRVGHEVAFDAFGRTLDGAHDGAGGFDEVVFGAGLGFLPELLLQVSVQKLIGIMVGRIVLLCHKLL